MRKAFSALGNWHGAQGLLGGLLPALRQSWFSDVVACADETPAKSLLRAGAGSRAVLVHARS